MKFAMTVQEKCSLLIQNWHFTTGDCLTEVITLIGKFDYKYNKIPAFCVKLLDTLDESTCIL